MPRAVLSDVEIEAFRQRTIAAATKLFAEQGFAAVTMRAIAKELEASPMTPYRYFENKAEIFAMVRADAFRRFADAQERAFHSSQEPLERLLTMREAYIDFAAADPDAYRVMFQLDQESQERYPELVEQAERSFSFSLEAARAAVAAGFIQGDPLTVAHQLWAGVHGLVSLHLAGKLSLGKTFDELRNEPGPIFLLPDRNE